MNDTPCTFPVGDCQLGALLAEKTAQAEMLAGALTKIMHARTGSYLTDMSRAGMRELAGEALRQYRGEKT